MHWAPPLDKNPPGGEHPIVHPPGGQWDAPLIDSHYEHQIYCVHEFKRESHLKHFNKQLQVYWYENVYVNFNTAALSLKLFHVWLYYLSAY